MSFKSTTTYVKNIKSSLRNINGTKYKRRMKELMKADENFPCTIPNTSVQVYTYCDMFAQGRFMKPLLGNGSANNGRCYTMAQ
jgi:hypothetical protein